MNSPFVAIVPLYALVVRRTVRWRRYRFADFTRLKLVLSYICRCMLSHIAAWTQGRPLLPALRNSGRFLTIPLTLLWLITEQRHSKVELNSTVCNLLRWAKRQGYRFIGKTLLAAWSSFCSKWCFPQLYEYHHQSGEWQASLKGKKKKIAVLLSATDPPSPNISKIRVGNAPNFCQIVFFSPF